MQIKLAVREADGGYLLNPQENFDTTPRGHHNLPNHIGGGMVACSPQVWQVWGLSPGHIKQKTMKLVLLRLACSIKEKEQRLVGSVSA